ncbi:MAG: hypothetical protein KDD14_22220 [Saprospiraceae bacterium]|nr:hypothetical protein [Saprospiraceae bacterium]
MKKKQKMVLIVGILFSIMGTITFVLGPREWARVISLKRHGIMGYSNLFYLFWNWARRLGLERVVG